MANFGAVQNQRKSQHCREPRKPALEAPPAKMTSAGENQLRQMIHAIASASRATRTEHDIEKHQDAMQYIADALEDFSRTRNHPVPRLLLQRGGLPHLLEMQKALAWSVISNHYQHPEQPSLYNCQVPFAAAAPHHLQPDWPPARAARRCR